MASSSGAKRLVRIVVLSNAAAGAEKQALALSVRLRDRLLRHPVVVGGAVRCVRVPFHSDSIAHTLPPLLQVAAARLTGNAFFGYNLSDDHKAQLQDGDGKQSAPLNVVVGCGRTTVALCATLKLMARHPNDVFNIQIQHPRVPLSWFDAVVAPRHDFSIDYVSSQVRLPKPLHLTTGTVHDISKELLAQQTAQWREKLHKLTQLQKRNRRKRACVAWLIGGPCRGFAFSEQEAHAMVKQFVHVLKSSSSSDHDGDGLAVFVTFSRRTPAKVVEIIHRHLRESFTGANQLFVWDGEGENPYYAFLGLASLVVTTPDSISMTTEAIASAKPVCSISTERAKGKFLRFHQALFNAKLTSPFTQEAVSAALGSYTAVSQLEQPQERHLPSDVLERELNGIADAITQQILRRI